MFLPSAITDQQLSYGSNVLKLKVVFIFTNA